MSFLLQLAVYLFVQSYVFSVVHSRFVQIQQSAPQSATSHDVATDFLDENELDELHETSLSTSLQDEAKNGNNLKSVGLRFKRRSSPCVLGKTIRKWNDCLGRHFTEIHCRRLSVACLSPNNVPPKCKKNTMPSLERTVTAKYLRAAPARRDVILPNDHALRDVILFLAVGTPSRYVLAYNFSSLCDARSPRRIQFIVK